MRTGAVSQEQEQLARNRVETYVRAMFALKGLGQPDPQHMLPMVDKAVSLLSTDEVRHPDTISLASLGDIQAVVSAAKTPPPANAYGANAPATGNGGDSTGKSSVKAIELLERLRNGAASVRETTNGAMHADRGASGARFDDMNTMDWGSPGGLAKMRDLAIQKGLPWAANNTELLRLGPAAIGALADMRFKQEAYKRLTTDASFKAKEIVTLARFAKREHLDANHLAGVMSHGVKTLAGDDIPARRRLDAAFAGYMDHPERPETKQRLFNTLNPYADDPSKKPEVYKMLDAVKIKREEFDASRSAENAHRHTSDVKQEQATAKEGQAALKHEHAVVKQEQAVVKQEQAIAKERKAELETKKAEIKVASFDALPDDPPKPTVAKPTNPTASDPAPHAPPPKKTASGPSPGKQPKPA